jgi:hypothetical protein
VICGVNGVRNWSIRACSAVKKEGLTEGLDWYGYCFFGFALISGWWM